MLGKRDVGQTVIGQGTVIQGTLRIEGSIHIDGRIEGGIESDQLISIGPKGVIVGDLIGNQDVIVGGLVEGHVAVRGHLCVRSGGTVRGEVSYHSLEIAKGGSLLGQSQLMGQALESSQGGTVDSKVDAKAAAEVDSRQGGSMRPPMLVGQA